MKFKIYGIIGVFLSTVPLLLQAQTLAEAVNVMIKTNPNVLASVHERQAVDEEINQAKAGYLPKIDITLGTGWEKTDSSVTQGRGNVELNRSEASLQLQQMLFDGMATKNEVRRQTARSFSRAYNVAGVSEDKALEAVTAYLNVLRRQKLVALAETNLEAHQRTHDQIKLRSEYGVGRKADMDQSNGRLALAEANLLAEKSNLVDAKTTFQRVIGVEAKDLTDPESPRGLIPKTLDEAIALALDNHPILKSAKEDVESANAQYDAAGAAFLPRVDLELGATANNDLDGIDSTNNDATAMIRLRYNLLDGGHDSARRKQTAYLINQAAEIRNNTHRQVEESMRLAWNALQTVDKQKRYFKVHLDSSKSSRDAYQQQFNLGQRTLLDLLDSENEVFTASQAYVNSQYDQLIALYRILNSMGALLPSLHVSPPKASAVAKK